MGSIHNTIVITHFTGSYQIPYSFVGHADFPAGIWSFKAQNF